MEQLNILFGVVLLAYLHVAIACSIENVTNWFTPVSESIVDTHRGIISTRKTSNIQEISNITPGEGLKSGPYVTLELVNNDLILSTNDNFQNYEENETALMFTLTVQFKCSSGSTKFLVFTISVNDTNNNDPQFMPAHNYEFTVAPPLPPGYLITDCVNDILVRDIDLTTKRIDFAIHGSSLFEIAYDESSSIPKEFKAILKTNTFIRSISEPIILTISATDVDRTNDPPRTRNATVKILGNTEFEFPDDLIFSQTFYLASFSREQGFVLQDKINLRQGYDAQVNFTFQSEYSQYFELNIDKNNVSFSSKELPEELYEQRQIYIVVKAEREHTSGATATVILQLPYDHIEKKEHFDKILYNGLIENGAVSHETITLSDFTGSNILLTGDYAALFESSLTNGTVRVQARAAANLPTELTHLALTLQADSSQSVLLLTFMSGSEAEVVEYFDKVLYKGKLENNIVSHDVITLSNFTGSNIVLSGDHASAFKPSLSNGVVTVHLLTTASIPSELTHITLILQAGLARSVLSLGVISASTVEKEESFNEILYSGKFKNGLISHDTILLSNYSGTNILLTGDYATNFESSLTSGIVSIRTISSPAFPVDLTHTTLTLKAGRAEAVLLIDIITSEDEDRPSVTFNSSSYFFWADVNQVGVVGRVQATETNGKTIVYSLNISDDFLKDRISVNNEGNIIVSEVIAKGVHSFSVIATAQNSQASASVPVLIRVDALPECKVGKGLSPLIVLERLEEKPHRNLVILNRTEYQDCRYTLSNIWPEDQSWLYVDEDGLHATAIDREDKSIAFMTLSQIQVELRLHCDSDEVPATRRSLTAESLELGTDNYGSNKWVLADTIVYNERRSFVNLIVIDINDNSPIFIGKENEPIYIGYPISELEDTVLPRALTELKATDADIGENAALVYSSLEDVLAVAPHTGLVHVRNNAKLQNNSRLTVYATDQNGKGRNGSLDIVIKLLDKHQIAVLTIRNSFLDDENLVMTDISNAIGYNLKVLRAMVISDSDEESARKKRATSEPGASLQLYVYGLLDNEPVDVTKLTIDITNSNPATVDIARARTLQEHLENIEECDAHTGLLAATIVLAVLLFLVFLAIPLWFFLKWRKTQNYEPFSDRNSLASRDISEFPKIESITKPRLNIDELKRSERRLQEMLDVPIQDVRAEPENDKNIQKEPPPAPSSTIVNISTPEMPIVIQSIDKLKDNNDESDDNDEFGEQKQKPRKSVVTFNENVEKIIHLEDGIEDSPDPEYEIFKF